MDERLEPSEGDLYIPLVVAGAVGADGVETFWKDVRTNVSSGGSHQSGSHDVTKNDRWRRKRDEAAIYVSLGRPRTSRDDETKRTATCGCTFLLYQAL